MHMGSTTENELRQEFDVERETMLNRTALEKRQRFHQIPCIHPLNPTQTYCNRCGKYFVTLH